MIQYCFLIIFRLVLILINDDYIFSTLGIDYNYLFGFVMFAEYIKSVWTFDNFDCYMYSPCRKSAVNITASWILDSYIIHICLFLVLFIFYCDDESDERSLFKNTRNFILLSQILFQSLCMSGKFNIPRLIPLSESRLSKFIQDTTVKNWLKITAIENILKKQILLQFIPNNQQICFIIMDYSKILNYYEKLELKWPELICNSLVIFDKTGIWINRIKQFIIKCKRNRGSRYQGLDPDLLFVLLRKCDINEIISKNIDNVYCLELKLDLMRLSPKEQKEIHKSFKVVMTEELGYCCDNESDENVNDSEKFDYITCGSNDCNSLLYYQFRLIEHTQKPKILTKS